MVERKVAINATGGGFTDILATIQCRRMEIVEDDSVANQGLAYKDFRDNFTATKTVAAGKEPIVLGNVLAHGNNAGPILGRPAGSSGGSADWTATKLISIESKNLATSVLVREYE
jgi:hypothetical protein